MGLVGTWDRLGHELLGTWDQSVYGIDGNMKSVVSVDLFLLAAHVTLGTSTSD